jgi:hypothetical protein
VKYYFFLGLSAFMGALTFENAGNSNELFVGVLSSTCLCVICIIKILTKEVNENEHR